MSIRIMALSGSPTSSITSYMHDGNLISIPETLSEKNDRVYALPNTEQQGDNKSLYETMTICEDSEDEELLVISEGNEHKREEVGLFDIVKREFRVKTAEITNVPDYGIPRRKAKTNFIQNMKNKVGIAIEYKNRAVEEMQNKQMKLATRLFHMALLNIKGLDPDEGVMWSVDFEMMDKDRLPLRVMPTELKEIKEGVEIDCYLGLANCLQSKDRVPYRRIKNYCLRILDVRDDNIPALTRCGMACYYLREYELSRFYLQSAKDLSHEPVDPQVKKYLNMVENQLGRGRKKR